MSLKKDYSGPSYKYMDDPYLIPYSKNIFYFFTRRINEQY